MAALSPWQKKLSKSLNNTLADLLLPQSTDRYQQLWSGLKTSIPEGQKKLVRTKLLPALVIYQLLLENGSTNDRALGIMAPFIRKIVFGNLDLAVRVLDYLPDPFPIVRFVMRQSSKETYGPGSIVIVKDNNNCFAQNTIRCFIFDFFTAQKVPQLTTLFCDTDDWLSAKVSKIEWCRTQTLGYGGVYCDFCWRRKKTDVS
jgi:hypothetical protein